MARVFSLSSAAWSILYLCAKIATPHDVFEQLAHRHIVPVNLESIGIPEQVHLAFAGHEAGTGMTVSWATKSRVSAPQVWYTQASNGNVSLDAMDVAPATTNVYYAEDDYELYNHHAVFSPQTEYFYVIGSQDDSLATSSTRNVFKTASDGTVDAFNAVIYGDMGVLQSESSIEYLNSLALDGVELIWHIGDISYADDAFEHPDVDPNAFTYEEVFNKFMNLMSPVMSKVPYMVTVGNHEAECYSPACLRSTFKKDHLGNFSAYNARFRMPSNESNGALNMWFSWTHGPVQFISINSETDFDGAIRDEQTGTHHNGGFGNQVKWLNEALAAAHARRDKFPWIFVGTHRPLYSVFMEDTTYGRLPRVRNVTVAIQKAFEDLFLKFGPSHENVLTIVRRYKVDAVLMGHVHSYERQLPIAHGKSVRDGVSPDASVYHNPKAPVYILTGAAGNIEDLTPYLGEEQVPEWNVV
ncbi:unnamed protein product [Aphanomyces euteiches]